MVQPGGKNLWQTNKLIPYVEWKWNQIQQPDNLNIRDRSITSAPLAAKPLSKKILKNIWIKLTNRERFIAYAPELFIDRSIDINNPAS
jgi:hypothetical protein